MAEIIRMPRMSDTMEEGVIASWLKKVGDEVKSGEVLAEVETDKATMELESFEDGTLLYVAVKEKDTVPVDGVIAIIGDKNEKIDDLLKEVNSESAPAAKKEKEEVATAVKGASEKKPAASEIKASVIKMPKMSDTMTEGVIAKWIKKKGDKVASGDILAEVETDKATMELEAYEDGILLYVGPKEGDSVPVDDIIAIVGEKGADYAKLLEANKTREKSIATEDKITESERVKPEKETLKTEVIPVGQEDGDGRVIASPLAKRLAQEKGYDLRKIQGSGDYGRIIKRDIENYEPSTEQQPVEKGTGKETKFILPPIVGEEKYEEMAVSQMRKTIAKRLSESKFTSPHFYLTMEINMDRVVEARKSINEVAPVKISFNDIIIKACTGALRQHPKVNASWLGDKIRFNKHIHIGVAVAVEEGLLVPVIKFADNKSLARIATEVREMADKAKNKQLQPKDWEGNTFTISNLGMFGIDEFTAIINPPDACILAVGGIKETAIVKNGMIVPGNVMKVTLSCDHRVVDGATGAAFLQTLKGLLEDPVRILI
ncbi:MAG: pyruvate dehydrogenase complex dihydrolipoamide acetyltransferase [Cyclobacteriaceae bacterium]|nr:pyruvate dehydrogenase complex dihydrolipoamide acetyltransferase [Cyclobacteriaceae bacterium]